LYCGFVLLLLNTQNGTQEGEPIFVLVLISAIFFFLLRHQAALFKMTKCGGGKKKYPVPYNTSKRAINEDQQSSETVAEQLP